MVQHRRIINFALIAIFCCTPLRAQFGKGFSLLPVSSSGGGSFSTPTFLSDTISTAGASGTSRSVNCPASVGNNTIVFVVLTIAASSKTVTPADAGMTLFADEPCDMAGNPHVTKIYWKREDSTPNASYNFTWSGAAFNFAYAFAVNGAITSGSPIDTMLVENAGIMSRTVWPGASFTPSINNVLAVWVGTQMEGGLTGLSPNASTPPTGWTEIQDASGDGVNVPIAAATLSASAANTTYECSGATWNGGAGGGLSFVFGVIPATAQSLPANTVDVVIDFENSTAGTTLTDSILTEVQNGNEHGLIVQKSDSSTYTGMTIIATPFSGAYMPSFVVSRRTGITTGTRAFQHDHSVSAGGDTARLIVYYPGASTSSGNAGQICVYALMQFNASSAVGVDIDHITFETVNANWAVLQQEVENGNYNRIRLHSNAGDGGSINITSGQNYWVGLKVDTVVGTTEIYVYNADTQALVGSLSGSMNTGSTSGWVLVGGGYIEGGATGTTKYDNVTLQFNVTGWPLITP